VDFFLFPSLKSIMKGARFADVAAIQESGVPMVVQPSTPRNSEVLIKPSRISCAVENTSLTT
jgi:hypothetical protein